MTFKLNFDSSYDKSSFDAHVGGGVSSIFSASANISSVVTQNNISGSMEVSAYQDGGDPTQLVKIFGKCGDHYCISSCSLTNLTACQGIIDGIISYSQNNLPGQVDFENGQVKGTANPLGNSYMAYEQLGLKVGSSVLTPDIVAARSYLGSLYKQTLSNSGMVDHILSSQISANILADYKTRLEADKQVLGNNLAVLENDNYGAIGCYLDPTRCVSIRQSIDSLLLPIDTQVLDVFSNGYVDNAALIIPIGGDQYQVFNTKLGHFVGQESITLGNGGQTLHIEGIDPGWNSGDPHFVGDLNKTGDDVYNGKLRFHCQTSQCQFIWHTDILEFPAQYMLVKNPS